MATSGTRSILQSTVQVAAPIPVLLANWQEASTWPMVAELVREVANLESPEHKTVFDKASNTPIPVVQHYSLVTVGRGIRWKSIGGDLVAWSSLSASRLIASLSASGEINQWVAPLVGFAAGPLESIEFTPTLRLRPVTEEERDEIASRKSILGRICQEVPGHLRFLPIDWIIENDILEPVPGHGSGGAASYNLISEVVRSLRIFKDGRFDFPVVACRGLPCGSISFGTPNQRFPSSLAWSPFDSTYTLHAEERQEALDFARAYLSHSSGKATAWMDIAATRIDDAYRRELDRDRMIDSVVALEAVLLHDDEKELGHRMATRGAVLLGSDPDQRGAIFTLLKEAYGRRSGILHGKSDSGKPRSEEIMSAARQVLLSAIERTRNGSLNSLLHSIDLYAVSRYEKETLSDFIDRIKRESAQSSGAAQPPPG